MENQNEEKFKVYELDFGDTNLLDEDIDTITDWIKSDMDSLEDNSELQHTIKIKRMTRKEINELPEWA